MNNKQISNRESELDKKISERIKLIIENSREYKELIVFNLGSRNLKWNR